MINEEKIITTIDPNLYSFINEENNVWKVDAAGLYYKKLNESLRTIVKHGAKKIELYNVCGQRYIGTDLGSGINITIFGTPGNDLGAFMNGPKLIVNGNVQDGCGNTMNEGEIIIHGQAGDLTGHSMRGGKIFVRDNVGYRVGIHMKEYQNKKPNIVIGGSAQDFLGEYMAGGIILVLGLNLVKGERCKARFVGTGMHGGVIYERGKIIEVEKGTRLMNIGKRDKLMIQKIVKEFCNNFDFDFEKIMNEKFHKIVPISKRPYGKLYSH
jgi:glutamate synthase domain-containing protein 3